MKCRVVFSVVSLLGFSLTLTSCSGSSPATTAVAYVAHSASHSLSVMNIPADVIDPSRITLKPGEWISRTLF
jgi:hypothetical protein